MIAKGCALPLRIVSCLARKVAQTLNYTFLPEIWFLRTFKNLVKSAELYGKKPRISIIG